MNLKDNIQTIPGFPKEGILFRDVTPILLNPEALDFTADELAKIAKETGATVIAYDGNGNPVSTATGLALPSTKQCDTTHPTVAARRVVRTFDARNRVATLRFPTRMRAMLAAALDWPRLSRRCG